MVRNKNKTSKNKTSKNKTSFRKTQGGEALNIGD
jgi:hypothetical protein